jgi:release factor glutamine methyltransferase
MKINEVLQKTTSFFADKKIESPRLDAELLISYALACQRIDLYLKFDQPLAEAELIKCRDLVRRRATGEPVAYILGRKEFFEETFLVNNSVLVPRPETELIVEEALAWIEKSGNQNIQLLDLGSGTGCIGISILKKQPSARGILVERSNAAAEILKINCRNLDVIQQVEIIEKDVMQMDLENLQFDLIVSNPPYIADNDPNVADSVKKFEPHEALFCEDDGLACLKNWSTRFAKNLKPQSMVIFEIGMRQGQAALAHFQSLNVFSETKIIKDLAGHDRHVVGLRNS